MHTVSHWYRRCNTRNRTIDINSLVQDSDLQKEFAEAVSLELLAMPPKESSWNDFGAVLQKIAIEKIGQKTPRGHMRQNAMDDPEVKPLAEEIRKLRMGENAA